MASYDPDLHGVDPDKAPPTHDAEPRGRGCLFHGCVAAVVLSVLLAMGLALTALVGYRTIIKYRDMYTALEPVPLPKTSLSEPERKQVVERASAFRDDVEAGMDVEPLILTGDDLNALIQEDPDLKDRVFLALEGDRVKAQVSVPLDEFSDVSLVRGRYFNGEADVKFRLRNGSLKVEAVSMIVDGKPLPGLVRDVITKSNIFLGDDDDDDEEDHREPEFERRFKGLLRRIDSIEVKDGVMIVTPRASSPRVEDAPRSGRPDPAPEPPGPAPAPFPPASRPSSAPSPAAAPFP